MGRRKREPGPAERERAGCERVEEPSATAGPGETDAEPRAREPREPPNRTKAEAGAAAAAASARGPGAGAPRGPGRARRGQPWPATCRVSSRPTAARRRSSCRRTRMCWSATKVRLAPGRRWPEPEAAAWPSLPRARPAAGGAGGAPTRAGRGREPLPPLGGRLLES